MKITVIPIVVKVIGTVTKNQKNRLDKLEIKGKK